MINLRVHSLRLILLISVSLVMGCQTVVPIGKDHTRATPHVDAKFAELALDFLETGDKELLPVIAKTRGARHIAAHAQRVSLSLNPPTVEELVEHILTSESLASINLKQTTARLRLMQRDIQSQRRCWEDAATTLPKGALIDATLFLTVGYDIGVAVSGNASLNVAHQRFAKNPQELWFTCVHELNHAGFQKYHRLPKLADIKTNHDLANLIRYLTTMEGLAVYTARKWRAEAGELDADPDYVALLDPQRMDVYEKKFFTLYNGLAAGKLRRLENSDWEVLEPMSTDERLWYRVGARMANKIEKEQGRDALVKTVLEGPEAFFTQYEELANE